MKTCCVVSDLHLYFHQSSGFDYVEAIHSSASNADALVMGGDIFDFRSTNGKTVHQRVESAISWLKDFVSHHPHCHFYYLLGNHDHVPEYERALSDLAESTPNLSWHPFYFRLGDTVFIHGDAAGRGMNQQSLSRARAQWPIKKFMSRLLTLIYEIAWWLGIHRHINNICFPIEVVSERLVSYLEEIEHGPTAGVKEVYFGHTHIAISGYEHGGMKFHNCGSPVYDFEFNILMTEIYESAH